MSNDIKEIPGVIFNLAMILMVNIATVIMMFMLIFVSWKKGSKCWKKVAPKLYLMMVWTCYILIPIAIIVLAVYYFVSERAILHESANETWVVCYCFLCCSRICEFFFFINKVFVHDAKVYLMVREMMDKARLDEV
jgi:hypothetical protein